MLSRGVPVTGAPWSSAHLEPVVLTPARMGHFIDIPLRGPVPAAELTLHFHKYIWDSPPEKSGEYRASVGQARIGCRFWRLRETHRLAWLGLSCIRIGACTHCAPSGSTRRRVPLLTELWWRDDRRVEAPAGRNSGREKTARKVSPSGLHVDERDTRSDTAGDTESPDLRTTHIQVLDLQGICEKKLTSLTPGTGSTVRAAWFPT